MPEGVTIGNISNAKPKARYASSVARIYVFVAASRTPSMPVCNVTAPIAPKKHGKRMTAHNPSSIGKIIKQTHPKKKRAQGRRRTTHPERCLQCGKTFEAVSNERLCSDACRRQWQLNYYRAYAARRIKCPICGRKFVPKTKDQICCNVCSRK